MTEPDTTVVVVTWQGRALLEPCLRSVLAQRVPVSVLVVDNGSTDGTVEYLAADFPQVQVLALAENTGFAGGVAAALGRVHTRYVALLNNDAVADPDWVGASLQVLEADRSCAAVSARMVLADAPTPTINNTGVLLRHDLYGADRGLGEPDSADFDVPAEVFGASGGAAVFRTLAVTAVGGLDPDYFLYYEDTDLSWRLRLAGWTIRYSPDALVRHGHATSSDPGSRMFAHYNERNRLLTLLRNAPVSWVLGAVLRFLLTTASVTVRTVLRGGRRVGGWQQHPGLRLGVLGQVVRRVPAALRARRGSTRRVRLVVGGQWRGVDSRPVAAS